MSDVRPPGKIKIYIRTKVGLKEKLASRVFPLDFAEEPPASAVTLQMVEAEIRRDGLQPAGGRRTRSDRIEPFEGGTMASVETPSR